jgi:hypothetical protein
MKLKKLVLPPGKQHKWNSQVCTHTVLDNYIGHSHLTGWVVPQEDQQLREQVQQHGGIGNVPTNCVPLRTKFQCAERSVPSLAIDPLANVPRLL